MAQEMTFALIEADSILLNVANHGLPAMSARMNIDRSQALSLAATCGEAKPNVMIRMSVKDRFAVLEARSASIRDGCDKVALFFALNACVRNAIYLASHDYDSKCKEHASAYVSDS